ncbi:CRISPR-associated protein Csx16 [Methylocaldum sp. 14B]|jgi:CRISPR-associated protein Csx16|uniref:CRISPR-associated protein Csx16 n=1 Tax=Methylocaldum sp. 14B TaxID=1912213 RepID=UPI00098B9C08|nr:CRISPR-associated protein Csx16 [Methylocaldum sp. 14B]
MTTYLVSRHSGAHEWFAEQGVPVDVRLEHLNPEIIGDGDIVIGSLPVHLAAEVCAHGARYIHLVLDLSPEMRGKELTAEDMRKAGARLEEFVVTRP